MMVQEMCGNYIGYNNDQRTFTYTNTEFTEDVAYHFQIYAESCVGILLTLTIIDAIIAKSSYTRPDIPEG
ncbi:unnamed protein product [Rotaria sordida]|uniref:Uncharacterized protein n=1 Tax=Rotaria sordida TaxID=392033 RepID=A0A818XZY0_9BILA|nr:unnamed protein product [Rotaria sordida]CAF3747573.1 unnamed protein product [Rotaria sordida]